MSPYYANLSRWLVSPGLTPHGWPLVAANLFIYLYVCWLGFWFMRGTAGLERFFVAGWLAEILLWPLALLGRQAVVVKHVGALGLVVASLAAVALLLDRSDVVDVDGPQA